MRNNFKTIKNLLLLYFPLFYIAVGTMLGVFGDGLPYKDWIRLLVSVYGLFLFVKNYNILTRSNTKVFGSLALMLVLILLSTFYFNFFEQSARAESIRNMGDSVLWISIMVISYLIAYKNPNTLFNSRWIALSIPIYYLIFQSIRAYFLLNTDDIALISTAYYALFLFPFALMFERKWLMWTLMVFIFLTVVLSSKRAGFIAFIGALVFYAYLQMKINNTSTGSKLKYLLVFSIVGILGYYVFMNLIATSDIHLLDRLSSIQEDGGSGRDEIYKYTFELLCNSGMFSMIFGHGFNSVIYYSKFELSAHTDLLETPFDYGILGFIVYIIFYVRLFKYYRILRACNANYATIFVVTLFITLVLSLFAHLIIYPTHFLFFCMYWGLVMGECDRVIANQNYI